jgi:DegV family protein with EDD domain
MIIKIITDSTADLPSELAKESGITVVPAYLRFGEVVYRDRISFSDEEFYERMLEDTAYPITEPANPDDFATVYKEVAREADGIISIHISSKISATYNAAQQGKKLADVGCPIEVIDSESISMGLGLLSIAATEVAQSREAFPEIVNEVRRMVSSLRMLGCFDSVKYLARGGRISHATAFFGSMLNIKPMLTTKNGEVEPAGHVYRRTTGIRRLNKFVKNIHGIQDAAVVYSTTPEEAQELAASIRTIVPAGRIFLAKMGPILGAHGGPGALLVALRTENYY